MENDYFLQYDILFVGNYIEITTLKFSGKLKTTEAYIDMPIINTICEVPSSMLTSVILKNFSSQIELNLRNFDNEMENKFMITDQGLIIGLMDIQTLISFLRSKTGYNTNAVLQKSQLIADPIFIKDPIRINDPIEINDPLDNEYKEGIILK